MTGQEALPHWERPYFEPGGGDAALFYAVFGPVREPLNVRGGGYRCAGVPDGIELYCYTREDNQGVFDFTSEGYFGRALAEEVPADVFEAARSASECIVLTGTVDDPPDLDYLRDAVGLVTAMLDAGGVVAFDGMAFQWWTPDTWRALIFEEDGPVPHRHVTVMVSEDEQPRRGADTVWYHTRGLRKFGRPDISVRHVRTGEQAAVEDLCKRFIGLQALGGIVPEGEEVRMAALPPGITCHHAGDLDDPDFNNVHIEVVLPLS